MARCDRKSRLRRGGRRLRRHSDVEGLHIEGDTFDDFCKTVAATVADLLSGEDGADIHVEIIADASVRARAAA
jgi:hypothetical protein